MSEAVKSIIDKISSYNLFNNLYPGVIFCCILKYLLNVDILLDKWYENIILFYFCGSAISRFGSLVIETILNKKIKCKKKNTVWSFLDRAEYADYVYASAEDKFITTLSETNNTYRTLLSVFACSLIIKVTLEVNSLLVSHNILFFQDNIDWIILLGLSLLYLFSYKKQTKYIKKRIDAYKNKIKNFVKY